MMKFLALTSYLLARITLTLMSSFAITSCFQKVNFQAFNLLILNFELPSAFLYALRELLENRLFYVEITEAVVRSCSVKKLFLEI